MKKKLSVKLTFLVFSHLPGETWSCSTFKTSLLVNIPAPCKSNLHTDVISRFANFNYGQLISKSNTFSSGVSGLSEFNLTCQTLIHISMIIRF